MRSSIVHSSLRSLLLVFSALLFASNAPAQSPEPYDLENGNAAVEIVIAAVAPAILADVSANAGDAPLVLRITTMVTNSWFDATAPYHPTAVGVYSRLGRRPAAESQTNEAMNTALLYASKKVMDSLLPARAEDWRGMLITAGLDPDDDSEDPSTPVGIGNIAGRSIVEGRVHDGMNQLGTEGGRAYNPVPYADTTGYRPVNTPERLSNPSRWQPDIQRKGTGIYKSQIFVTPQYRNVEPYSYDDPRRFRFPRPRASQAKNRRAYRRQANEVLEASANLSEDQKLKAEIFDNKLASLGSSAVFYALSRQYSLLDFIQLDFLTNMAAFDAGIVVWQEKARWDAVRPFSAIRRLYGNRPVTAWGGVGKGTVDDLPASEWRAYLEEADHPEYPSASTCFCAAHAESARLYNGTDELGFEVAYPAGGSRVEPGLTPQEDTVIRWDNWSDFESDCGESRVWAGVHFQAAVDESLEACSEFGELAHDYLKELVDGTAAPRGPSKGRENRIRGRRERQRDH